MDKQLSGGQLQTETKPAYDLNTDVQQDPTEQRVSSSKPLSDETSAKPSVRLFRANRSSGPTTSARPHRHRRSFWVPPLIFLVIILFVAATILIGLRSAHMGISHATLPARNFTVDIQTTLEIDNPIGDVRIHTRQSQTLSVLATVDQDLFGFKPDVRYEQSGHTLKITTSDSSLDWLSPSAISLDITIPTSLAVHIDIDSGNIALQGLQGEAHIHTRNGNIDISGVTLANNSSIQTEIGHIAIDNSVLAGNGTIQAGIDDITFKGRLAEASQYIATTENGKITCSLPADTHAHISAKSSNGLVDTTFPKMQRTAPVSGGMEINGDIGGKNPSASLKLSTNNGTIMINRIG